MKSPNVLEGALAVKINLPCLIENICRHKHSMLFFFDGKHWHLSFPKNTTFYDLENWTFFKNIVLPFYFLKLLWNLLWSPTISVVSCWLWKKVFIYFCLDAIHYWYISPFWRRRDSISQLLFCRNAFVFFKTFYKL